MTDDTFLDCAELFAFVVKLIKLLNFFDQELNCFSFCFRMCVLFFYNSIFHFRLLFLERSFVVSLLVTSSIAASLFC